MQLSRSILSLVQSSLQRRNYVIIRENVEECIRQIQPGSTILVGGFGLCGHPEKCITALAKHPQINNLKIVTNDIAKCEDYGLGLLLKSSQVKRMVLSYNGDNKLFEDMYLTGRLEVEFTPQGTLAEKIRAAGSGIPAFYTATGVETHVQYGQLVTKYNHEGTPELFSIPKRVDIFNGKKFVQEESLGGDYALIKAWKADTAGNLVFRKSAKNTNATMVLAAKRTIVEVEELVPIGSLDPDTIQIPGIYVHELVVGKNYEKRIEYLKFSHNGSLQLAHDYDARINIAKRAAQEFRDGMYINLGIGMPMLASNYIQPGHSVFLQSENGVLGMGPFPEEGMQDADLINAGKETVTVVPGASYFSTDESFAMIRGRHIDLTILGAMEVSEQGDLANWIIPGKMIKGMGGAMDLAASHTRVVVTMTHLTKDGAFKIFKKCHYPLTAHRCVSRIITDLCVFDVTSRNRLELRELFPGVSIDKVRASTGCDFDINSDLREVLLD